MSRWQTITDDVRRRAAQRGFVLVAAGRRDTYQARVSAAYPLPQVGRDDALVILVGNDRSLWPVFTAAMRANPARAVVADPLDSWVMAELDAVFKAVFQALPGAWEARYCHELPPRRIAMQALAEVTGLAQTSPSNLSVHPERGPWIGLRAAVVVDVPGPPQAPRRPTPCDTCAAQPCMPKLAAALAHGRPRGDDDIARAWRSWLAVRDACPVGRDARYGSHQIAYHYTKDPTLLAPDPA